jgi:hypothetical protein
MTGPLVLPPPIVSILRDRAIAEVGDAASEIAAISALKDRERNPEWFAEQLARFDTHRALLDSTGWRQPAVQTAVGLNLGRRSSGPRARSVPRQVSRMRE